MKVYTSKALACALLYYVLVYHILYYLSRLFLNIVFYFSAGHLYIVIKGNALYAVTAYTILELEV